MFSISLYELSIKSISSNSVLIHFHNVFEMLVYSRNKFFKWNHRDLSFIWENMFKIRLPDLKPIPVLFSRFSISTLDFSNTVISKGQADLSVIFVPDKWSSHKDGIWKLVTSDFGSELSISRMTESLRQLIELRLSTSRHESYESTHFNNLIST